jgi:YfiH family protein
MHVRQNGDIRLYQFESLDRPGLTHAVFARQGGVSGGHWASLNMSISVGDSRENVRENRERAFRAAGRAPETVADLWQVHSADVVVADAPRDLSVDAAQADVIVTDRPGVTLFLRFADCVPIFLFDPKRRAVGLIHAGWRGTLLKAAAAAVQAMQARYGSRPADLVAAIGPSIGPCHYEIGPEVVAQTRAVFDGASGGMLARVDGRLHLDLWAANAHTLREAGVGEIEIGGVCTACHTDDFFSHRGEHGRTGRFGVLIGLS